MRPGARPGKGICATLIVCVSLLAVSSVCAIEVDTTRVVKPAPRKESLGRRLLKAPQAVVNLPIWIVENTADLVVNEIFLTEPAARLARMFARADRVWGFMPVVNYGGNSGYSTGLTFTSRQVFTKGERFRAKATYSTHQYQRYSVSYTAPNKFGVFRRPYVSFAYRKRPREEFYGLHNTSRERDEVIYTLERSEFAFGWHHEPMTNLRVEIGSELRSVNLYDGNTGDEGEPTNLDSIATRLSLSASEIASSRVWSFGAGVVHDWRDHPGQPSSGGSESVRFAYGREQGRTRSLEYVRASVDLRAYVNIYRKRLLALRLFLETSETVGNSPELPFYLRPSLGGREKLRSYPSRRFVDNDVVLASIEYRYPIWDVVDAFVFLDEGHAFEDVGNDFTFRDFHWSSGVGLRVWNDRGLVLSVLAAYGPEEPRYYIQFSESL